MVTELTCWGGLSLSNHASLCITVVVCVLTIVFMYFLLHIDVACCPHHITETDAGKCRTLSYCFRPKAGGFIVFILFSILTELCVRLSSTFVLVSTLMLNARIKMFVLFDHQSRR